MNVPRNYLFRYLPEDRVVHPNEIEIMRDILERPVEDISQLAELVDDESISFRLSMDNGLEA